MSQEQDQVLDMLAAGKISADEAKALLKALELKDSTSNSANGISGVFKKAKKIPEFICIKVESEDKDGQQVDIRVPLKLIKAGIKLGTMMPRAAQESVNQALENSGVNFSLNSLNENNLMELVESLQDLTLNVRNDGEKGSQRVTIHCE